MNRPHEVRSTRGVLLLLGLVIAGVSIQGPARAVESEPWRIGVLFWHDSPNDEAALDGIRAALAETKHAHELIVRNADSDPAKAARILEEFLGEAEPTDSDESRTSNESAGVPVDLVFAMGTRATLLAAERIDEIPIVFTAVTNPVQSRVVPSWKGSGRNLAGNSNWIDSETHLRVFGQAVPGLGRIGILRSSVSGEVSAAELQAMKKFLAKKDAPSIEIVEKIVAAPSEIKSAVAALAASDVQAIWIPIDFLIYSNMNEVLSEVEPHRIPLVSSSLKATRAGAVAGVVVDYTLLGKRAVVIALDILEGRKEPGAIPIGTMNAHKIVVNLAAARRCRYELPLSFLVSADSILDRVALPEGKDAKK